MDFIAATYRLTCPGTEVERLSRDIALEQTVEVPDALIACEALREAVVGRVISITPRPQPDSDSAEQFDVRIDYPADLAQSGLSALLNLIYGNISLKQRIRLRGLQLPASLLSHYRGPNLGVAGLRQTLGVFGRPLLATALKPRGSTAEQLAVRARAFAAGGGDLVKDDHNLADVSFDDYCRRVKLCQQGVLDGSQESGRTCLYFPNLAAPMGDLERRAEFLVRQGIRGVLIAPMIVGLDQVRYLAHKYPLSFMAHPTFAGAYFHDATHGMEPGLLLGTLFRMAGCDATVYPNLGGRFSFTAADCRQIDEHSLAPLGELRSAWPAPAGGMSYENLGQMASDRGEDSIFLIGGALLGDSADLKASTARFLDRIVELFPRSISTSSSNVNDVVSACELPAPPGTQRLLEHVRFVQGFRWDGRDPVPYKPSDELPFRDVSRTELIGTAGEKTAFDLRYFEIGPGGHSSLEKHVHTHVVIGTRGEGTLVSGGKSVTIKPFDVAYVPPLQVHQLTNASSEPFGFFCIVDHERDRPQQP
ncbi:MAG: cupin domain-containing protein [Planctomycetes bacterium]|nr:cupin domain-containing protein [Planctomycetota bacterium]